MQDLNDFDDFELSKKTVNFCDGIEFLMNDRKKSSSPSRTNLKNWVAYLNHLLEHFF